MLSSHRLRHHATANKIMLSLTRQGIIISVFIRANTAFSKFPVLLSPFTILDHLLYNCYTTFRVPFLCFSTCSVLKFNLDNTKYYCQFSFNTSANCSCSPFPILRSHWCSPSQIKTGPKNMRHLSNDFYQFISVLNVNKSNLSTRIKERLSFPKSFV